MVGALSCKMTHYVVTEFFFRAAGADRWPWVEIIASAAVFIIVFIVIKAVISVFEAAFDMFAILHGWKK